MAEDKGTDQLSHRLAAIVLADIVGYSRLMDADEDGTYAAIQNFKREIAEPIMAKHHGRFVKFTGDGFLAEFPTIHDAIEFSTEVQRALYKQEKNEPQESRLVLRIGINIGDIIVSRDGEIYGDGINIVSRLEELAYPGGIRVSDPVYQIVHKSTDITFIEVDQQKLKNEKSTVKTYDIDLGSTGWARPGHSTEGAENNKLNLVILLLILTIAALLAIIGWLYLSKSEDQQEQIKTVAVLPFYDLSLDKSRNFFADGMAEEVINVLASIDELEVASRTSVFAYKDSNLGIPEISRQLGVTYILEGSIRSIGNKVRITAQLLDVPATRHLWSQTYDRDISDIFAIQNEISRSVAEALKIELAVGEVLREAPTTNMAAYELYLQGHQLFLDRGKSEIIDNKNNLERAFLLLDRATILDPTFADAWADLAGSQMLLSSYNIQEYPIETILQEARAAIDRAVLLNPDLSQAWAVKGAIHRRQYEFEDSENALNRAIDINPNNETAWLWLGFHFLIVANFDEATRSIERAIEIAPNSAVIYNTLGRILHSQGDTDRARLMFEKATIELGYDIGRHDLAYIEIADNNPAKALQEITARLGFASPDTATEKSRKNLQQYIAAYFDPSLREDALNKLQAESVAGEVIISLGFLMLQNAEGFIDWLETVSGNRAINLARLYYPINRPMLNQQSLKDYIVKIGLLEYWQDNQFPDFCNAVGLNDFECE